jgi:SAM-dependent methyltransferase
LGTNDKRVKNAKKRLSFISKHKKKGTLLEIGFGDGVFLKIASRDFLCTGLDPSTGYKYIHDYLTQMNVNVANKTLETFSLNKKFDIICSFLVLEHIKDPISFIKLQIKHLSPKGFLIVEIPDIRKYTLFNSESLLTHEHLYHYCIESLSALLSKLNLELVSHSNKNISYGFSLIAAFKLNKSVRTNILTNGFDVSSIFQIFFEKRETYRQRMKSSIEHIFETAQNCGQTVAVYGIGSLFIYALEACGLNINNINFLYDDTTEKIGSFFCGKKVRPLFEIKKEKPDVILIFSEMFFMLMKKNVLLAIVDDSIHIVDIHKLSILKYD